MFANDKSIDNLESLFKEVRKYIELQGQYVKLDLVEKAHHSALYFNPNTHHYYFKHDGSFLFFLHACLCFGSSCRQSDWRICYHWRCSSSPGHTHLPDEKTMDIPANGTFPRTIIPR